MSSRAAQSPPAEPARPPHPDHHYVQASALPVTVTIGGGGEAVEVDVSWCLLIPFLGTADPESTYPQYESSGGSH